MRQEVGGKGLYKRKNIHFEPKLYRNSTETLPKFNRDLIDMLARLYR